VTDPLAAARSVGTIDALRSLYRDWAADYDRDVFESAGVIGTDTIARLFAEHVTDRNVSIIDLGCGTGAAGTALRSMGFMTIDGVDISPEMLAVAASKLVYRNLAEADLNSSFVLPAAPYDASICAGTFVHGHVGPDALAPITATLADGATVAWVIAADQWPRFEPVLSSRSFDVLHQSAECVRRDGPAEAIMFVAQFSRLA
jgi:predicted TPR repeat methyltransferase